MKRFFFILALLFYTLFPLAQETLAAPLSPEEVITPLENVSDLADKMPQDESGPLSSWMTQFAHKFRQWAQTAAQTPPGEATKWSQYNLLTPLYLMQTDASPISDLQGYGSWQSFEFGQLRLISCRTGLANKKPVFAAVQVKTNPNWFLHKPLIRLNTPVRTSAISYPLVHPLPQGVTKTDFYAGDISFPIILKPLSFEKNLLLDVTADVRAENTLTGAIETQTAHLTLTLTPETGYDTGICPWMIGELQWAPKPLQDEFQVTATRNEAGDIQLYYRFNQSTEILSVQIDEPWHFTELNKTISYPVSTLVIRPFTPVRADDEIHLKTITSFGFFDTPVRLQNGTFQNGQKQFPFKSALFGGLALFLFSPFFALFLCQAPQNEKALRQAADETLAVIIFVGIVTTLAWQARLFIPISLIQIYPLIGWVFFGLFLYLLYRPVLPLILTVALFWFLPKPYLADALTAAGDNTYGPLYWGTWWTLTLAWPFWLIHQYPAGFFSFYRLTQNSRRAILHMTRLPIILLLIWLAVGGGVNALVNKTIPLYTPETLKTALQEHKIVFVSAEPPVCFVCAWNKAVALKSGFAHPYYTAGRLIILRLPADTPTARLLQSTQGKPFFPVNLLYGPANSSGLLMPDYIDYTNLGRYLSAVMNAK
ncbi:MAG: hypothetical protein ACI4QM_05090 [Alphaproteobacteria bacterium]